MQVIRHPKLAEDIRSVAQHYAEISERVLQSFWLELDAVLESVGKNPRSHHFDSSGLRRANFRRFPYHLLYEVDDKPFTWLFSDTIEENPASESAAQSHSSGTGQGQDTDIPTVGRVCPAQQMPKLFHATAGLPVYLERSVDPTRSHLQEKTTSQVKSHSQSTPELLPAKIPHRIRRSFRQIEETFSPPAPSFSAVFQSLRCNRMYPNSRHPQLLSIMPILQSCPNSRSPLSLFRWPTTPCQPAIRNRYLPSSSNSR